MATVSIDSAWAAWAGDVQLDAPATHDLTIDSTWGDWGSAVGAELAPTETPQEYVWLTDAGFVGARWVCPGPIEAGIVSATLFVGKDSGALTVVDIAKPDRLEILAQEYVGERIVGAAYSDAYWFIVVSPSVGVNAQAQMLVLARDLAFTRVAEVQLDLQEQDLGAVAADPDGQFFVLAREDGTLERYDVSGTLLNRIETGLRRPGVIVAEDRTAEGPASETKRTAFFVIDADNAQGRTVFYTEAAPAFGNTLTSFNVAAEWVATHQQRTLGAFLDDQGIRTADAAAEAVQRFLIADPEEPVLDAASRVRDIGVGLQNVAQPQTPT